MRVRPDNSTPTATITKWSTRDDWGGAWVGRRREDQTEEARDTGLSVYCHANAGAINAANDRLSSSLKIVRWKLPASV